MIEFDAPVRTAALAAFVLLSLVSCNRKKGPDLGIDGWWDADYVASACQTVAASGEIHCLRDPTDIASEVETDFLSAFQTSTQCSGLSVNDFHNPKKDSASSHFPNAKWSLSFSIAISDGEPSEKDSTWEIIDQATLKRYASRGLENMNQSANPVCTIVKGKGGRLFQ